jgi:hypothetical protein
VPQKMGHGVSPEKRSEQKSSAPGATEITRIDRNDALAHSNWHDLSLCSVGAPFRVRHFLSASNSSNPFIFARCKTRPRNHFPFSIFRASRGSGGTITVNQLSYHRSSLLLF